MQHEDSGSKARQISHIFLRGETEPIRVLPEGREGSKIFVRRLGTLETDSGETLTFVPGEEELVLTQRIEAIGLCETAEVGRRDDLLTWLRIVPDGREGSTVYGRTLRYGEHDTGEAVHLRPGDAFSLRPDALMLELEAIDEQVAVSFDDGYRTITNTVWTWLAIGPDRSEEDARFLLAAARRLDACYRMISIVRVKLGELEDTQDAIPQRNLVYEIIGLVEMAVIAMNRALNMASQIGAHLTLCVPLPTLIAEKLPALKEIRNAYEHIEDRARGLVRGKPHPDALSIFNFERLFREQVVVYSSNELNLQGEATDLLVSARRYLKVAANELT
jgi:hypothetical protein